MKASILLTLCLVLLSVKNVAQTKTFDYSKIEEKRWVMVKNDTLNYGPASFAGSPAWMLKRNINNGKGASIAYPKDLAFKDGTIELDIAGGKNAFVGIAFRIRDNNHYETLYFRPGSSNTGYAVQYMPKKQFEFDWWHYEDLKYQSKATLPVDHWFHVKAMIKGPALTVFVNNAEIPVMTRNDLDLSIDKGSVGFWLGNCNAGAYRNLKVTVAN